MKKAKIVLSLIALLAIVGGTLAFKAARFTSTPAWTYTDEVATFGTTYGTAVPFCYTETTVFISQNLPGSITTTLSSTAGFPATARVTLEADNGNTITVPLKSCSVKLTTITAAL